MLGDRLKGQSDVYLAEVSYQCSNVFAMNAFGFKLSDGQSIGLNHLDYEGADYMTRQLPESVSQIIIDYE
jgi:hypothetical protein